MSGWKKHLGFLDKTPYSVKLSGLSLFPLKPIELPQKLRVQSLGYELWPFQINVLKNIAGDTLILGLPTGLGKTSIAGAYLRGASTDREIRVLFLTPSIPLGVQQTIFIRSQLKTESYFISGETPPSERQRLKVWNSGFAVATPQTVANDLLVRS